MVPSTTALRSKPQQLMMNNKRKYPTVGEVLWCVVLFFVPPSFQKDPSKVDEYFGSVGAIIICFICAPPYLLSFFQIMKSDTYVPTVTTLSVATGMGPTHQTNTTSTARTANKHTRTLCCKPTYYINTVLAAVHMLAFPICLRLTAQLKIITNYMCALFFINGSLNCFTSGAGFMTLNCTILPIIPIMPAFLNYGVGYQKR